MTVELGVVLALLAAAIVMFAVGRPRMDAVALLMLTRPPVHGGAQHERGPGRFCRRQRRADRDAVRDRRRAPADRRRAADGRPADREGRHERPAPADPADAVRRRAGRGDEFDRRGRHLHPGRPARRAAHRGLGLPPDDAAQCGRAVERHDHAGGDGTEPCRQQRAGPTGPHRIPLLQLHARRRRRPAGEHRVHARRASQWLPDKSASESRPAGRPTLPDWIEKYGLADRELRLRVSDASSLAGAAIDAIDLGGTCGATVLAVERAQRRGPEILDPTSKTPLLAGDVLLVDLFDPTCDRSALAATFGLEAQPLTGAFFSDRSQDLGMSEALVGPDSTLIGRTVHEIRFRTRYGLTVLGLRHGSTPQPYGHLDEPLRIGDTLLLLGPWKRIDALQHESHDLVLLGAPAERDDVLAAAGKAPLAMAVLAVVVGLMVTGVVPNVQAGLIGVLLLGALGCVDFTSAYGSIHWKSLVLIAGMMPFSLALQRTGGVDLAADALVSVAGGAGHHVLLAGIFVVTAAIGLFVSNTATAVLMAPVAIAVAKELGVSPYPFAMTVAVAASAAYMTPVSSPVNTLVVGPGNYGMGDFVRVGVPLTVLVLIVAVVLIPLLFPF